MCRFKTAKFNQRSKFLSTFLTPKRSSCKKLRYIAKWINASKSDVKMLESRNCSGIMCKFFYTSVGLSSFILSVSPNSEFV